MNILITGGAGFIGSSLADRLINDNTLFVVDNFNDYYDPKIKLNNIKHNLNKNNYYLYFTDITNYSGIQKIFESHAIDTVIHLAACAGVRASVNDTKTFIDSNIIGTFNILELMKIHHIKKLIFASSSSVYGNSKEIKFHEEIYNLQPISPYAVTKLACENLIYTYSYLYNIQSICLRFFTVYGPRQRPDLAIHKFTNLIKRNQPISIYGDGQNSRDYIYIKDIINGIISCIHYSKTNYEIINLGGGQPIKLIDTVTILSNILKKTPIIRYEQSSLADVNKTISDNSKAQRLLNFNTETKFIDGITNFIDWFNNNGLN